MNLIFPNLQDLQHHKVGLPKSNEIHIYFIPIADIGKMHKSGYSHTLIKQMLSLYMGISEDQILLEKKEHGKPFFTAPDDKKTLYFNLSHTEGYLAAAFSTASELGIDIERHDRNVHLETISKHFFHPDEKIEFLHYNNICNKKKHFMEFWTLKEAFLKGLGVGLTVSPASFMLVPTSAKTIPQNLGAFKVHSESDTLPPDYTAWMILSIPAPEDYVCSIAYRDCAP